MSGRPEDWNAVLAGLLLLEIHLHPHPHGDVSRRVVDSHNAREDTEALVEVDVGNGVCAHLGERGLTVLADDGERVDAALAPGLQKVEVVASATGATAAGREDHVPAGLALLVKELALLGAVPELLSVRLWKGWHGA